MIQAFFASLGVALGPLVVKVLQMLGFALVTFSGLSLFVSYVLDAAANSFGDLTSTALTMVSLMGIDHAMTIILSAYISAFTFKRTASIFGVG